MGKASIITPMYNAEQYIGETICSILDQTYANWEAIVIDDNSTDNGAEIVEKFVEKDSRIKLIKLQENVGGAVARNMGIKAAKGDYIAFLDSDDLWHPEKLNKQVQFMENNNYSLTYTWYEKIDVNGNSLEKIMRSKNRVNYEEMLKYNYIGCLTAMYSVKRLGKIYMPEIGKRHDYALWLEILKRTEFAYCLEETLAQYRLVQGSLSSSKISLINYHWALFRRIEKFGPIKSSYYLIYNIINRLFLKKKFISKTEKLN
ncbi:glycosyl transferase [Propionigenium maris DSM 9537]|uniref:Glycosyl transferase n=1 Tax=Propionigenium maris DSM 9537 TaxID=1123000 RepID=A0A9W6GKG9_9FUSO|nr:glycosyltransferase family 2 protein [Propionigenium maris]GLI56799.1 glycosyl transferase [Propionigenium maris DSM 9537]